MKYKIANTCKEFDSRDAALLTQRLVPLAVLYKHIFETIHYCQAGRKAQDRLEGVNERLACEMVNLLLCFIGENPYDIPEEQSTKE